jgi:hypothetical protein
MREVFPELPADEVRECPAAEVMPKSFRVLACGSIEDLRSLVDLDVLSADIVRISYRCHASVRN